MFRVLNFVCSRIIVFILTILALFILGSYVSLDYFLGLIRFNVKKKRGIRALND